MFVHLHVQSHYSFFDSPTPPEALAKRAASLGMPALALTDHGVLHGVPAFVAACRRQGIRPVVGIEFSFWPDGEAGNAEVPGADPFHLVLLCRDETGYRNLCRLSSATQGYRHDDGGHRGGASRGGRAGGAGGSRGLGRGGDGGGAGRPLPLSLLWQNAGGLLCLSGSHRGPLVRLLAAGQRNRAMCTARLLAEIFPGAFFVELPATLFTGEQVSPAAEAPQPAGKRRQPAMEHLLRGLVELAQEAGIPVVATADVHYAERREALMRRVLLAGRGGPTSAAGKPGDLWLCSEKEMSQRLAFLPGPVRQEALARTLAIAQECRWELQPFTVTSAGSSNSPGSAGSGDILRYLVEQGRRWRYPAGEPTGVAPRLQRELEIILARHLADYFLLAHQVASWCRQEGIPVGPGRGSAAGSLVCYCLGITDVDPLEEGLLFERFLNPERPDLPDIDMDVCQRRRPDVIQMLTGEAGALGVVTFTTLGARSALRLVGKALGLPAEQIGALTAALPRERGPGALAHALDAVPELRAIPRDREPFRTLFGAAALLEGIPVGRSRHPSGIIAVPPGKEETLPLYVAPDGQPVSQYDADSLEMLGLPKLDVLGLRHLTVASDTVRMVRQTEPSFSLEDLDPRDPLTWDLVATGQTVGCFQLESEGVRNLLERMRPRSLRDLAIAIASYKPGSLRARRPGAPTRTGELPPCLRPILGSTGGILVYQEQVMEAGHRLAGMSLGEADLMRRALEKAQRQPGHEIREWESRFIRGTLNRGIAEAEAREAFRWLRRAAGYTFNRAHATCYARLAYQAAYLKAHYPAPYLAALLSNPGGYYPPALYAYEARRLGIAVLPPHPNHSGAFWRVEEGAIRAGLLSLPGIGFQAALACLRERASGGEFRSPQDLAARLRDKVSATALSSLVAAWHEAEAARQGRQVLKREGLAAREGEEVVLEGRVVQGERIPAARGAYRLVLLVDTGREMVHVHVPARIYERDALEIDPRHLTVRGRLERRGGHWRLLASALGEKARRGDEDDPGGDRRLLVR